MTSNDEDSSFSEGTIDEFSEPEYEDDPFGKLAGFSAKYMTEITNLLSTFSNVNCENALSLNKDMQQRLQEVRKRLQTLLHAVKQRYSLNQQRLKLNLGKKKRGVGMRGAYLKGGTFFFKGNMFFKDIKCRSCPNNEDYEYRKNVEGEMFPMDFELSSRHVWSLLDKKALVQAVKEQLVDYLSDCKSRDINKKSKDLQLQVQVYSEKLSSLLSKVDDKFQIDWEQVSAHNLSYRHSPSSCKTMWLVYLHPSLKRSAWTAEENKNLLLAAQRHGYQNWQSIAKSIPKRSDYQCFVQYQTSVCFNDTKRWGRWDKRDDAKLQEVVQKKTVNGIVDWTAVASYFPHKSKTSLHCRYMYYLDPKISHVPFTPEEDLILLAAVEEYGEKFSLLPRDLFPNRSIAQLRMRYKYTLLNRHTITPWSVEDDKKLIEYVAANGTASWLRCSELLGNHNRTSCRTRFNTIQKFLEKNPNATLEDIPRKKKCVLRNSVITKQNWVEKVAELRENPGAVLAPPSNKVKRAERRLEKQMTKSEIKALKVKSPHKCKVKKARLKTKRVVPYVERLRVVEQQLYHYFKYAYNFRLGTDVCTKPPNATLCEVAHALDFQADSNQEYNSDTTVTSYIRKRCKHYLQRKCELITENESKQFGLSLPPSWSTALSFRALCVQSAQLQNEGGGENERKNEKPSESEINNHRAVQRFRNRMFALFFQTALLSRLEPQRYNDLIQNTTPVQETIDTLTIEEFTQNTTSAYEQQQFDLSRVKNEFPSQFSSNQQNVVTTNLIKKSKGEVLQKKRRKSKDVFRNENETKMEISNKKGKAESKKEKKTAVCKNEGGTKIVVKQAISLLETNSGCTESNPQTTNIPAENFGRATMNQTVALQQPSVSTYLFIKQENNHSPVQQQHTPSSQLDASNLTIQENLTMQAQQKMKAKKRKLLHNSTSGTDPYKKQNCNDAAIQLTNIKTEYEI